jgi:hypothetical protein
MSLPLRCAIALVTGWTRLYTTGLDPATKQRRRAEIESDLWEFHEDARRRHYLPAEIATHMVLRLVAGLPHDVLWRVESVDETSRAWGRAAWLTAHAAGVSACVAAAYVLFLVTYFVSLMPLPDSARVERTFIRTARSLAPAPPPLAQPAGLRVPVVMMPSPPPPLPPR